MALAPTDEFPHAGVGVDEWVFTAWTDDGRLGVVSGHRLLGAVAWYWSALVEVGQPLMHIAEWEVRVRRDPFVVKAPEMWAEHHCDAPLEQWSIGNEAYAVALDDADEALGRAYGHPTPLAMDLEWYATAAPTVATDGFEQVGVVHGSIEILGRPTVEVTEIPAHRWRRWTAAADLPPVTPPAAVAHTGLRAPFAFPDGAVADWVLSPNGWRTRSARMTPDP